MNLFISITSPLDQFEIRNLISINAAILGNLNISLTNIALYLTLASYIVLIMKTLSTNQDKIISNE
jgi:F-type H+-transporting ATPase subunit a